MIRAKRRLNKLMLGPVLATALLVGVQSSPALACSQ